MDKLSKISKNLRKFIHRCFNPTIAKTIRNFPLHPKSRLRLKRSPTLSTGNINSRTIQVGLKAKSDKDPITENNQKEQRHQPVGNANKTFEELGRVYSKARGSYVGWNTEVNLKPPSVWGKESPVEDKYIADYYNTLQHMLFETGYPETEDRTARPRKNINKEQVVVAILESPVECIATLLEGGRQLPDGFHLVLSASWLSKITSEEPNLYSLLLHKAITFHRDGSTYIDEFAEPRLVTYFVNFFTHNATGGQRNDGEEIEKDLDCAMSSSIQLSELVDDKVWTRCIMSDVDMAFPETLAFMYKPQRRVTSTDKKIRIVELDKATHVHIVEKEIGAFLTQPFMNDVEKVVVKPSGPCCHGSIGVTFHNVTGVISIENAVKSLLADIDEGSSVLVETFVETFEPLPPDGDKERLWCANESLGFRARATVCRDFNDKPRTTLINCGILEKSLPINGDNTVCQSLDSTLLAYNIFDVEKRRRLDHEINTKCEAVLKAIIEYEKTLSDDDRTAIKGQTDVIGIDMIVTMTDDVLTPFGIEVNSHDCTINCQINEFMNSLVQNSVALRESTHDHTGYRYGTNRLPGRFLDDASGCGAIELVNTYQGRSVRPWVRNMINRSQCHVMKGKRLLVIGAGGYSKRHIWPDAEKYGIKVTLVDSNADHFAKDQVHYFIHYDFDDHSNDFAHACNIVSYLQDETVDGCLTFWEDCVPLAALVGELIGTTGSTYEAALNGKKKSRAHSILRTRTDDIPHLPRAHLYSSETHSVTSKEQLCSISHRFSYPAVLKLEHGSSAVGVSLVHNQSEMEKNYANISGTLKTESDLPGIGLGHDNTMVVVDYHAGSEHDVDVVISGRKLVAAFISDNGPTRIPMFTEVSASMPTALPVDKQAQLVAAAYQCCIEIGLSDGTFNAELKMTPTGPKLIEINARMGGFYLREWIQRLYGVDIMLYSFMVACGIKPFVPKHPPDEHLMGIMLLPSLHQHILEDEHIMRSILDLHNKGEIIWSQFSNKVEKTSFGEMYEEPFGNLAVVAGNIGDARDKLLHVCKEFGIECSGYNVRDFVKYF